MFLVHTASTYVPLLARAVVSACRGDGWQTSLQPQLLHTLFNLVLQQNLDIDRLEPVTCTEVAATLSSPEERLIEYGDHGLSVTTIAICLLIRIGWRIRTGFPAMPATMSNLARLGAKTVHYGLYIVLCAQITVGIFLASTTKLEFIAKGYNINYSSFKLAPASLHDILLTFHIGLYWTIVALLSAHVLAALKHHFLDKDEVLLRMLPFTRRRRGRGVEG